MAGMHCCIKPQTLGLSAYFSQFNSNDVFFHHELMFAMALDFQLVSSKILKKKQSKILFFSFDAWKSIHQNINKIRVGLNLAQKVISLRLHLQNHGPISSRPDQ